MKNSTKNGTSIKYSETLADISLKIEETSKELSSMLDDLTGSPSDLAGLNELKELLK